MTEPNSAPAPDPADGLAAPARRADLETVDLDDEVSIYDARGNTAVTLNATASRIWCELDGSPLPEIVRRLAVEYDTTPERIADDVVATIARFRELGLLA